jgi:integrase
MADIKKITTQAGTRWRVRVYVGLGDISPKTGKPVRQYTTRTFDRKKDADAYANRLEHQKDMGVLVTPSKELLGRYLRRWLAETMRGRVRERTWSDYSGVLRRYIEEPPEGTPAIGKVRLDRLTPGHVQAFYAHLRDALGLSPRTIRSVHAVVRQGLGDAFRTGTVARNVAELAKLPKMERRTVVAMSPKEAERFLEAARSDRYYALWCVLLAGGLRPGEALALTWPDVDLDAGKIHVQRSLTRRGVQGWKLVEPKTAKSRRAVVLPAFAVSALKAHRAAQAEERLLVGSEYQAHGFVFATEFGAPLALPNLYRRNYRRVCAAAELGTWEEIEVTGKRTKRKRRRFIPRYRLYDLRHTAATLLMRAGVHPKAVSERLGHSSVAFTLDTYSASLPDMQEEAADKLEAMLGG